MTTILAYSTETSFYIGCDSRATRGNEIQNHVKKIFSKNDLYFAITGHTTMFNIIKHYLNLKENKSSRKFIEKTLISKIQNKVKKLQNKGFEIDHYRILVVHKGRIYLLDDTGDIEKIPHDTIIGMGSGGVYASSFFNAMNEASIKKRIKKSIQYASTKDVYTGGKIKVLCRDSEGVN